MRRRSSSAPSSSSATLAKRGRRPVGHAPQLGPCAGLVGLLEDGAHGGGHHALRALHDQTQQHGAVCQSLGTYPLETHAQPKPGGGEQNPPMANAQMSHPVMAIATSTSRKTTRFPAPRDGVSLIL